MGICQIIFTCWIMLGLGVTLAQHGTSRTVTYSFWATLVSSVIQFVLLYYGGFYG